MNDLRFNLTEKMVNILKKVLIINELLKSKKISKNDKKELRKEKDKLVKQFIREFQNNNRVEIKAYKELKDTIN